MEAERVNELARNFWYSAILRAAIKLDVFSLLEDQELTQGQVAQNLGTSPRYVQAFLDSCVTLDLLETKGDKYGNSPLSSSFLVKPRKPMWATTLFTTPTPGAGLTR